MGTYWQEQNIWQRFVETRQVELERDRRPYESVHQEIVTYIRPDLTVTTDNPGEQGGIEIVDGTPQFDAKIMAKWFIGNLVGPNLPWLSYRMANRKLRGDDAFNAFMQRGADYMLEDVFPWPSSNFYAMNNQFALDGLTIGSPVMLVESDGVHKTCTVPHYTQNYLKRDYFGNDTAYHRKWKMNNFVAHEAFGNTLPQSILNEIKQGDYLSEHEYLMCICRAGDPIFQYEEMKPENNIPLIKPWMKMFFCTTYSSPSEQRPLNYTYNTERGQLIPTAAVGYDYKPFHSWHYFRQSHETYARTPAWEALPDTKALNTAWSTIFDVAEAQARPPSIVLDSLKGRVDIGADGVTYVSEGEYDRPPVPYESRANYAWAMEFIDRRTQSCGRHFYSDIARMIQNYSKDHTQPPTAYQLSQMISETMVFVGPAITSYAGPYLHSIVEQFLEFELKSGRFAENTDPPAGLDEDFAVEAIFTGPLMEALRLSSLNKKVQQPLMMAAPVFELWPDSRQKVRAGDLVEYLLESSGFPQGLLVPQEEYEALMEAQAEEQRQQQMLENMESMSKSVQKLQKGTDENSPLRKMTG